MGVVVVFEGITLNKSSELLYDTAETVGERRSAPISYVRALENLIFGVVFGETIATGIVADLPRGVPSPFKELRQELKLNVDEVDQQGSSEDILLKDPQERELLRDLILRLDGASMRQPAWSEHARREIIGDGDDPALRIDLDDPSEYFFQKLAKFSPAYQFWPDRELQELVPASYLDRMLAAVSDITQARSNIREKALRAFFSRNVLAHILIFRRYQIGFAKRYSTNPTTLHIPYATRASLLDYKKRVGRMIVRDYIVPRVLIPLLDKAHDRTDFRVVLHDYASGHTFDKPRNFLAEALTYEAEGQPLKVQKVIDSLARWSGDNPTDTYRIGKVAGPHSESLPIAVGRELVFPYYYPLLKKVFPELDNEGAAGRHFSQPKEQSGIRPSGKAIDLPSEVQNSSDIFLSYASEDHEEAERIQKAIEAAGGTVFLDKKSLEPGDNFAERIRAALYFCGELWLLVSPSSLDSEWVITEWGTAWALQKTIVPILHRCKPQELPARLSQSEYIDMYRYMELVAKRFPKVSTPPGPLE